MGSSLEACAAPTAPACKTTRRQLRAAETKSRIFSAAVREINEKGFPSASIENITAAASVGKGTFYTHFESKEALIAYTFRQSDAIYTRAYRQVKDLDFLSMVTQFVRISYTEYEKRGKGIIKAMIAGYFTMQDYPFYAEDRPLLKCLRKIVEKGRAEGLLRQDIPSEACVTALLSSMIGVEVMWCFDRRDLSLAAMIESAVRTTARGMML